MFPSYLILSVPLPVYILNILNNVWAIMAVMSFVIAFDPVNLIITAIYPNRVNSDLNLSNIALHGKLSHKSKSSKLKEGISRLLYVSKSSFTHFYVFGTFNTLLFIAVHTIVLFTTTDGNNYCLLPLSLFLIQCMRRLV